MRRRALLTGSLIFFYPQMIHLGWILLLRGRQSYKLELGWMCEEITGDLLSGCFRSFSRSLETMADFSSLDEAVALPKGLCLPTMRQCGPRLPAPGCSSGVKHFLLC